MNALRILPVLSGLLLAPLLPGIVNRTKARFGGRRGQPLLQAYFDLLKLLRKGAVYSRTTTWVFRAGPSIGLAATLVALTLIPIGRGAPSAMHFTGDLFLLAYCLGLVRFFTVLAALDTGSAFEGMGASREVQFSALAEPALIVALAALARLSGHLSLSDITAAIGVTSWEIAGPALALIALALFVVFLSENSRIPVDDPNTHLELTMIHEVMILDHSGPDLAFIEYGAALKFWILGSLVVNVGISGLGGGTWVSIAAFFAGMSGLAVGVGVVESTMARYRLLKVPRMLWVAVALSVLSFTLIGRFTA
ncbi:NADH-quinone oxidoreductase subunit H [Myxococcota bacterium]|nr:NADH-quinone oxidoreductase subunit H [Myxococcota bacterium]MBU1511371.1 NADH-quinone oxidoreductase subunit H [Myxococcota bacterium]